MPEKKCPMQTYTWRNELGCPDYPYPKGGKSWESSCVCCYRWLTRSCVRCRSKNRLEGEEICVLGRSQENVARNRKLLQMKSCCAPHFPCPNEVCSSKRNNRVWLRRRLRIYASRLALAVVCPIHAFGDFADTRKCSFLGARLALPIMRQETLFSGRQAAVPLKTADSKQRCTHFW